MFGLENESARSYELIADVTKSIRDYVFTYIDGLIIFLLTQTDVFSVSTMFWKPWTLRLETNEKICSKNSVIFLGHMVYTELIRVFNKKFLF